MALKVENAPYGYSREAKLTIYNFFLQIVPLWLTISKISPSSLLNQSSRNYSALNVSLWDFTLQDNGLASGIHWKPRSLARKTANCWPRLTEQSFCLPFRISSETIFATKYVEKIVQRSRVEIRIKLCSSCRVTSATIHKFLEHEMLLKNGCLRWLLKFQRKILISLWAIGE